MSKGYKAFGKGLVCRNFQYKENEVFEHTGRIEPCDSGFHFCENPLDTLDYYPLIDRNGDLTEFTEVEAVGDVKTEDNKSVTNKLHVGAKLGLPGFVKASFDFLWEKCSSNPSEPDSGFNAQLASSGDSAQLASSGDSARLASSGRYAQLASSGRYAQLASSGRHAQLASSGDSARLASSGDSAQLASSGRHAQLASSGDSAQLDLKGSDSVGAAIGSGENRIRGTVGCWITLAEWGWVDDRLVPLCVKTVQIDGEVIKADTWYKLEDGQFVVVE
ncbi:DUF7666 domain-containing protein [Paenibacillus sp. URB8-2]|uniref:DUF7666 domain-containing protein n=1 Tax=Paenibacillus sp. URB8-2 TaxID=2741301 RepID=UPI0015BB22A5|nr:hypothetical protein [Paenibacillus sp. URB8-2]BCG57459.1 hypothetical protein PUR_08840 [Paenibacillus sp. URB8-2]